MAKPTPRPQMEVIPPEVLERIAQIRRGIDEHKAEIEKLRKEADGLVVKHTLAECRAIGCTHTRCGKYACDMSDFCMRSKSAHGAVHDYYNPLKPVFKPKVTYPTLGWKTVVGSRSRSYERKVVKETAKTLVLHDKSVLLKSTIYHIEDCTYIRDRSGYTYICADDPASLSAHLMLLDVVHQEHVERATRALRTPETPEPDVRV